MHTKAFQSREHASEREKLQITAQYYSYATGELDEAARTYEEMVESHPKDFRAYSSLAVVDSQQGKYEEAVEMARQAMRLAPDRVNSYGSLAAYLLALLGCNDNDDHDEEGRFSSLWPGRNRRFEITAVTEDDFSTGGFASDVGNGVSGWRAAVAK